MKLKVAIVMMVSLMLALGLAGIAGAQSVCDTIAFENGTAQPGGTDTVCGSGGAGHDWAVIFDGAEIGSATADEYGDYCITFTVPADATVGTHTLDLISNQQETECPFEYVVEAAATAPAAEVPVATTPATLPATGFMLVPAGGLLASGLGMLLFRKRRR